MIDIEKNIISAQNKLLKKAIFDVITIFEDVLKDPAVLNVHKRHISPSDIESLKKLIGVSLHE